MSIVFLALYLSASEPESELTSEPLGFEGYLAAEFEKRPEVRETLAEFEAEAFAKGEPLENWQQVGLSLEELLERHDASPSSHAVGTWQQGGRSLSLFDATGLELGDAKFRYDIYDDGEDAQFHNYYRLGEGVYVHSWGALSKIGSRNCWSEDSAQIVSKKPREQWSQEIEWLAMVTAQSYLNQRDTIFCLSFVPKDDRFVSSLTDQNGHVYTSWDDTSYLIDIAPRETAEAEYLAMD
ncbi:hypothetical protein [Sphingomicrobium flavum]|uniref:hypothetical protein n=1 Tax=Sphingomicrobium flavum TaxID=1229164 RepID=UPI0021ADF388|nr:hypothetical protein [Sphingomicrobium flavum]